VLFARDKSDAIAAFESKVQAIKIVTLDSKQAILAAEEAYKALTEEEKEQIMDSLPILVAARTEYDALVVKMNRQKTVEDSQKRVDKVIQAIDSIGTVSLESRDAIRTANFAYQGLNAEEQSRVTNYAKLTEAEAQLAILRNIAKDEAIKKFKDKFIVKVDTVDNYSTYTPKNNPKYANIRSYISTGIAIQNNSAKLFIIYNYTAEDWIFFNQLTIVVDGKQYNKTASNVWRQAAWGDVIEQYIEELPWDRPMHSEEIKLLDAIANSKETIVRFRGSDGNYDLKVSQTDKNMIKDALAFYSALAG
jgi:hypothetical protein